MPVRTSTEAKGEAYRRVQTSSARMGKIASDVVGMMNGAGMSGEHLVRLRDDLINIIDHITRAQAVPGIADYAKEIEDDPTYDAPTEYATLKAAAETAKTTLETVIPSDGPYVSLYELAVGSGLTPRQFNSSAFASGDGLSLKTAVQAVADAVEF